MENSLQPCKRLKSWSYVSEGRISELPDSIIQHIMSFLDAKDAIRTCVLSKRWQSLWTLVPSLLFHCDSYIWKEVQQFASFVDKTLTKYASSKIKKFLIKCSFNRIEEQVDSWIEFAVNHEVEELCLQGFSCQHYWPKAMYTNSSVRKMSLHGCWSISGLEGFYWTSLKILSLTNSSFDNSAIRSILVGSPLIECLTFKKSGLEGFYWTSLKILSLTNSSFDNSAIRSILVGSPLIECLTFKKCRLDNYDCSGVIDASCTSLKELVIIDKMCCQTDQQIDVVAPNLLVLTISGFMHQSFNLVDVSSLVEANIDFSMGLLSYSREKKLLEALLQSVDHVNKLKVGIWCIQGTSTWKAIRAKFSSESHKAMEVEIISTKGYLPGLSALLYSLPDLEQLTINLPDLEQLNINFKPSEYFEYSRKRKHRVKYNCLSQPLRRFLIRHLRSVEIAGFAPGSCSDSGNVLLELVQYLLGNANVLQKLIINAGAESSSSATPETLRKLYEVTQKLLSFPRASADAAVMFGSHLQ